MNDMHRFHTLAPHGARWGQGIEEGKVCADLRRDDKMESSRYRKARNVARERGTKKLNI